MDRYLKGAQMPADRALNLARVLGVRPEWLILGMGSPNEGGVEGADWVTLPRYDLQAFSDYGKPDVEERVRLRRELLGRWAGSAGLWVAEMPSDAAPEIAHEGDLLLCSDPSPPLADGRVYAFRMDSRVLVRRVQFRPDGLVLRVAKADPDPFVVAPKDVDRLYPIARILAAIVLQPV